MRTVAWKSFEAAAVALVAAALPTGAGAAVLYNSAGFEPAMFSVGALPGQDGWVQLGATNSSGAVHGVASGNPIETGVQAVTLTRDGADGGAASYFNVPLGAGVQAQFITINWDMYVPENTSLTDYGPGFSVEAYTTGNQRVAAFGMDAADGSLYQVINNNPSEPNFTQTPEVRLNEWQNWKLILDMANELAYLWVDGNVIVTGESFLENINYAGGAGDKLIDASLTVHATDNNALDADGEVYIDNYYITDAAFLLGPGDYNGSGLVEQGDLDLVLSNWGDPDFPVPSGWVNDLPSGLIDQAELDAVLQNWGSTGSAPAFPASPVPEPAAALALMGLAVARSRPGRRDH